MARLVRWQGARAVPPARVGTMRGAAATFMRRSIAPFGTCYIPGMRRLDSFYFAYFFFSCRPAVGEAHAQ